MKKRNYIKIIPVIVNSVAGGHTYCKTFAIERCNRIIGIIESHCIQISGGEMFFPIFNKTTFFKGEQYEQIDFKNCNTCSNICFWCCWRTNFLEKEKENPSMVPKDCGGTYCKILISILT